MLSFRPLMALLVATGCSAPLATVRTGAPPPAVKLVAHADQQEVDVLFDGQPFTSYRWQADIKRPVLYPLRTAEAAVITRGWPLEPRPDEPTDHPHHIGFWMSYGDVNGVDFWGNSTKVQNTEKKGTIVHRAIESTRDGAGRGE